MGGVLELKHREVVVMLVVVGRGCLNTHTAA